MQKIILLALLGNIMLVMANAQNKIGIGTNSPEAQLHTVGSVRFDTLAGTGVRPVYADALGNISGSLPALPLSTQTNNTSIPIPDYSCVGASSTTILSGLPTTVPSSSIKVTINILHARLPDLTIYLTAPNGTLINLFRTVDNSAPNLVNTTFSDQANLNIGNGNAPFTGIFKPVGSPLPDICIGTPSITSFGAIGGGTINPNGTWTLKLFDNTSGIMGTLQNWTISVDPVNAADGVWGVKGNAGTNQYNFIGTTDDNPLNFKVNNRRAGTIDSSQANAAIGFRSLESIRLVASQNAAFGNEALRSLTIGYSNTAIGNKAMAMATTGYNNVAVGNEAMTTQTSAKFNTAVGFQALMQNTEDNNVAMGSYSMRANTVGKDNTALGTSSLYTNLTGGSNVANGYYTMYNNVSGSFNTVLGTASMLSNTFGSYNTAVGASSLYNNNTGKFNVALGYYALYNNTSSDLNIAIGNNAGGTYNNGAGNIFVGAGADAAASGYTNTVAIGRSAIVTGNNMVRIGNSSTTSYGGYAGWSNISDGRFKKNIREDVPGLAFISRLRPVTYNLAVQSLDEFLHKNNPQDTNTASRKLFEKSAREKEAIVYTGFVAQEVEDAASMLGFNFSGVDKPQNTDDTYGLRYAEFVVPLVKGMQEQQEIINNQQQQINELKKEMAELKQLLVEKNK